MGGRGVGPRGRYNLRDHEKYNRRLVADEGDRVHQRVGFGRVERKDELEDPVQGEAQTCEPVWLCASPRFDPCLAYVVKIRTSTVVKPIANALELNRFASSKQQS